MQRAPISWRFYFPIALLSLVLFGLFWRLIELGIINRDFLLAQSTARIMRTMEIPASRGMIFDRNQEPLAISTPVESVWINPKLFSPSPAQLSVLSKFLSIPSWVIKQKLKTQAKHEFVYLKRGLVPEKALELKALKIPGVNFQQESKRFYPEAEIGAHVVGFTNVDDRGQEGLELAYNHWLQGISGKKRVLKDRLGNVIEELELLRPSQQGHNLQLSIDQRIQYVAYRDLKAAVEEFHAKSGSIVVLDAETGEILAMVNQPSYNPNSRGHVPVEAYRNRAVTDKYEPGSIIKPFTAALALESGRYKPSSTIDTSPGWMRVGGFSIRDEGNEHGVMTLTQIIEKSSNIGVAKIMLSLPPHDYWKLLRRFGFGEKTASGFPGETNGTLIDRSHWYSSEIASSAYGYGMSVSVLQLAQAYSVFAAGGILRPVSFVKQTSLPEGVQIIKPEIARQVAEMLKTVVATGSGTRARVPGYWVAGKTGTAYIAGPNGYDKNHRYMSSFVGFAPVTHPRFVIAVAITDPKGQHFAAYVAAPVFSKVMSDTLRLFNVKPDDLVHLHDEAPKPYI